MRIASSSHSRPSIDSRTQLHWVTPASLHLPLTIRTLDNADVVAKGGQVLHRQVNEDAKQFVLNGSSIRRPRCHEVLLQTAVSYISVAKRSQGEPSS